MTEAAVGRVAPWTDPSRPGVTTIMTAVPPPTLTSIAAATPALVRGTAARRRAVGMEETGGAEAATSKGTFPTGIPCLLPVSTGVAAITTAVPPPTPTNIAAAAPALVRGTARRRVVGVGATGGVEATTTNSIPPAGIPHHLRLTTGVAAATARRSLPSTRWWPPNPTPGLVASRTIPEGLIPPGASPRRRQAGAMAGTPSRLTRPPRS